MPATLTPTPLEQTVVLDLAEMRDALQAALLGRVVEVDSPFGGIEQRGKVNGYEADGAARVVDDAGRCFAWPVEWLRVA
jgi:hypothetical protein